MSQTAAAQAVRTSRILAVALIGAVTIGSPAVGQAAPQAKAKVTANQARTARAKTRARAKARARTAARPPVRLAPRAKSAPPSLRIRTLARAIPGKTRSSYIREKHWDKHPVVRKAITAYLGQAGRSIRDANFDVRAVFRGARLVGYTIHAATHGYSGNRTDTVLHVNSRGIIVKQTGTDKGPASIRLTAGTGRGRAAAQVRQRKLVSALSKLPGAKAVQSWRARRIARRQALIADFKNKHGIDAQLADQAADPHIAEVVGHSKHDNSWVFAVSDLHVSTGEQNPGEDFRRGGPALARFLRNIDDGGKRRATMVCGGDCFEFIENAPHSASDAELEALATEFIEGHKDAYAALARAVVPKHRGQPQRGLRVIFTRGNHDIQMVKKPLRDHIMKEIARVGGLRGKDVKTFMKRVAFAGDMAVLGKKGEWLMLHGDLHDPSNNWRENSNPFRYNVDRGGPWNVVKSLVTRGRVPHLRVTRTLESNMGYAIVQKFWNYIERSVPGADNAAKSSMDSAAKGLLARPGNILRLGRVLWTLLGQQKTHGTAAIAATRADDYQATLAWAERTGVHKQWGLSSPQAVVERLDVIKAQMPKPVHERMSSPLRAVNLARMIFGGAGRILRERKHAESNLLHLLTSELPNVVDIMAGHTHRQSRLEGRVADRGRVVYRNTGTWTTKKGKDIFTVAVSRAKGGRLVEQGLFAFDSAANRLVKQSKPPAPNWDAPVEWAVAAAN